MYTVNEESGEVSVCVQFTGEHSIYVELNRDIILELAIFADRTADLSDINTTTLTYAFSSGSQSGDVLCNTIGITIDGIVENIEEFSIKLTANPPSEDVLITQPIDIISITDAHNSKLHYRLLLTNH